MREALRERTSFFQVAPHLSTWMPIMIPIKKWWQAPYFWAGTRCYDLLANSEKNSYYMTKAQTLEAFPMINSTDLFGALVYYGKRHVSNVFDTRNADENSKMVPTTILAQTSRSLPLLLPMGLQSSTIWRSLA